MVKIADKRGYENMRTSPKGNGIIFTESGLQKVDSPSTYIGITKEKYDAVNKKFGSRFCIVCSVEKLDIIFAIPAIRFNKIIENIEEYENNQIQFDIVDDSGVFLLKPRKKGKFGIKEVRKDPIYDVSKFADLGPDDAIEKYIDLKIEINKFC